MERCNGQAPGIRIVIGLGNPGPRYRATRHNMGFRVVDRLAERHGGVLRRRWRLIAEVGEIDLAGRRVALVRSRTYMNESGRPVAALRRARGIRPEEVLVVLDDADLPLGEIRLRPAGGSGGHRGMQSVLDACGSTRVPRLRVGIGRPGAGSDLIAYVLTPFAADEEGLVEQSVDRAAEAVAGVVGDGIEATMNRVNGPRGEG